MAAEPTGLTSDSERFRRLCAEFEALLDLDPAERGDALARAAADDGALGEELRGMLLAHERPQLRAETSEASTAELGDLRGYRALREIGRGGMGRVVLAERADGRFARQVAIKLLDHSPHDSEFRRRFQVEREILARLRHPNIVRLLDAGECDDGTPYLVMEYIEGEPLDHHLRARAPTLAARIALFEQVAAALAHAHRMLVSHRDLKPGNVLVDRQGQAHLLDFGIARLLDDSRATATVERALTPRYAAPEQVAGEPTSTATDIYQLGALFYELLCNGPPFATQDGPALLHAILEGVIEAPSKRAQREQMPHARQIDADLDAICLCALRKEPEARYASVDALLADLARWRHGGAVEARRGGRAYRARKFARRHWRVLAVLTLVAALTATFIARLQTELNRTEQERAVAEQATELIADIFGRADPARAQGEELTLREAMDQSVERLRATNDLTDPVRARVLEAVGSTYVELSQAEQAVPLLGEAAAAYARVGDRERDFRSRHAQAVAMQDLGDYAGARAQLERVLSERQASGVSGDSFEAELHSTLGILHQYQREPIAALAEFESALAILRGLPAPDRGQLAHTLRNLGDIRTVQGDVEGGRSTLQEAQTLTEALYGPAHPESIRLLRMLGRNALKRDDLDEASRYLELGWERAQKTFSAPHGIRVQLAHPLALVRLMGGRIDDAAALMSAAAGEAAQLFPDDHPSRATIANDLALIRLRQDAFAEATALAGAALLARAGGPNAAAEAESRLILALADCLHGNAADAGALDDLLDQVTSDPMTSPRMIAEYRRATARCAPTLAMPPPR